MARNGANAKLEEFVVDTISIPDYFNKHLLGTKAGLTRLVDAAGSASCCPFHDDVNPSFRYWKVKKFFNCFGCGVSGDVINLHRLALQQKNNVRVTRDAALKDLCRLYNIKVPERASVRPTRVNVGPAALGIASAPVNTNVVKTGNVGSTVVKAGNESSAVANPVVANPAVVNPTAAKAVNTEQKKESADAPEAKAEQGTVETPTEILVPTWVIDPNESVFERCRKQVHSYSVAMDANRQKFNMLEYKEKNAQILNSNLTLTEKFVEFTKLDTQAGIEISMTEDKLETANNLTIAEVGSLF